MGKKRREREGGREREGERERGREGEGGRERGRKVRERAKNVEK